MSSPTGTVKAEGIVLSDIGNAPPQGCPMRQDVKKRETSLIKIIDYPVGKDENNFVLTLIMC